MIVDFPNLYADDSRFKTTSTVRYVNSTKPDTRIIQKVKELRNKLSKKLRKKHKPSPTSRLYDNLRPMRVNETQKKSLDSNSDDFSMNLSGVDTILIDEDEEYDYESVKKPPKVVNNSEDENENEDTENNENSENDEEGEDESESDNDVETDDASDDQDSDDDEENENENEGDEEGDESDEYSDGDEEDGEDENDKDEENDENDYLKNPIVDENSLVLPHHVYSKLTTTIPPTESTLNLKIKYAFIVLINYFNFCN